MTKPTEILVDGVRYVPDTQEATRVSIHGMYEAHLFHPIKGRTVDEVIANWLRHNSVKQPARVGEHDVDDLGPSMLCPATVLNGDRELRRVGQMVFPSDEDRSQPLSKVALDAYREELNADPDVVRLLALSNGDKQP